VGREKRLLVDRRREVALSCPFSIGWDGIAHCGEADMAERKTGLRQFVDFYEEFLPDHEELSGIFDAANSKEEFARTAVEHGGKHGYKFSEDDVMRVMNASENRLLERLSTVHIRTIPNTAAVQDKLFSTVGCCW